MIRIQTEDFDVGAELESLTGNRHRVGAAVSFVGLVRDIAGDGALDAMTLEHYADMTARELARIEAEARARWPLDAVLVIHRVGRLEPGARIVLVVATSAHRRAAFEACDYIMDFLKTRAPFWKKETLRDGTERWVAAREDDDCAAARWHRG